MPATAGLSYLRRRQRTESSCGRKAGDMRNRPGKRPPKGAGTGIMQKSVTLNQRMSRQSAGIFSIGQRPCKGAKLTPRIWTGGTKEVRTPQRCR